MKLITQLLIVLLFPWFVLFAQTEGKGAAPFLRRGVDAAAMGMGGAYSSITDGASSVYWNPAGLTNIDHGNASFMGAFQSLDRSEIFGAVGYNFNNLVSLGIAYYQFGISEIPYYGNVNTGSYDDSESSIYISAAKELILNNSLRISFGLTGKFINHSLENYSASAINADLGVLATFSEKIRAAIVLQDFMGSSLSWEESTINSSDDKIPSVIRVGLSYLTMINSIGLVTSGEAVIDNGSVDLKFGAAARIVSIFGLRAGIVNRGDDGENNLSPSFGLFVMPDLKGLNLQFDYAAAKDRIDGFVHYINLSLGF